jgi:hypothetical protein
MPGGQRYDGILMARLDTVFEIEKAQYESYRRMGSQKRSAIGFELSDNMRDISFCSYRSSNPTQSALEIQLGFLERVLGWRLPQRLKNAISESKP